MWPRSCTEQFLRTDRTDTRTDTSPKPRHHHPVLKRKLSLARFLLKVESLAQRNPITCSPSLWDREECESVSLPSQPSRAYLLY